MQYLRNNLDNIRLPIPPHYCIHHREAYHRLSQCIQSYRRYIDMTYMGYLTNGQGGRTLDRHMSNLQEEYEIQDHISKKTQTDQLAGDYRNESTFHNTNYTYVVRILHTYVGMYVYVLRTSNSYIVIRTLGFH